MDFETYLRFALVLVFVLGLVLVLGWVLKRAGIGGGAVIGKNRRLGIVETAFLGPKHRLILVRRDAVEHLVLISPMSSTLVESGIVSPGASGSGGSNSSTPRQSFEALVKQEATLPAGGAEPQR
jgi:flagellar protein FliO/FliZ